MGYLNETTGILSGRLPAPHDSVRIEIGPLESHAIYVAYEGSKDALLSSGAIDRLMASTIDTEHGGRDVRLRPYHMRQLPSGVLRIVRGVASSKTARDLPGIRDGTMQLVPLLPRLSPLRVVR